MSKSFDGSSNSSEEDLIPTTSKREPDKQMPNNVAPKIVRTISSSELNSNNIILLRSAKTIDGGHILLRTDNLVKNNILVDDGGGESKIGHIILQPNSEFKKGMYLQGVKRLGTTAPIFLLSSGDVGSHLIIHTTPESSTNTIKSVDGTDDGQVLLKGINQGLEVVQDNDTACSSGSSSRSLSTPIGSGMAGTKHDFLSKYFRLIHDFRLNRIF